MVKRKIIGYQGWLKVGIKKKRYFQPTKKCLYNKTQVKTWINDTHRKMKKLKLKGRLGFREVYK